MITISAHLLAYVATLLVISALLLFSFLFASFNEWLSKLTVFGGKNSNQYISILVISIMFYLIFMVVFSGVGKENRNIQQLTRMVFLATIAFACFVVFAILLKYFIA